ncbi:MAG: signal peptidase II [Pseudomonadota bacterium]
MGTQHRTLRTALWPWLLLALVIIVADQLTKALVVQHFQLGDSQRVTSYFNLVRAHNAGAAFSFLAGASGWQRWLFTGIGAVATGLILWQLNQHRGQRLISLAMSLILGGALGNVIDRLLHGHVIDFLDFHWSFLSGLFPGGHFPSFNVADSAICAGAVCLVLSELRRWRRGPVAA